MNCAVAYFRKTDVVVHAQHRTVDGLWIAGPPVFRIDRAETATELIPAVLGALDRSRVGVPAPAEWKAVLKEVLVVAKVRSWNALARGAKLCSISRSGQEIVITPNHNGGLKGEDRGFHEVPGRAIRIDAAAPASDLLQGLVTGEARCT